MAWSAHLVSLLLNVCVSQDLFVHVFVKKSKREEREIKKAKERCSKFVFVQVFGCLWILYFRMPPRKAVFLCVHVLVSRINISWSEHRKREGERSKLSK